MRYLLRVHDYNSNINLQYKHLQYILKYCKSPLTYKHKGVITSINLHDYSFTNNIEFGVSTENKLINNILPQFSTNIDKDAWETSMAIAEDNEAVFIKRPG